MKTILSASYLLIGFILISSCAKIYYAPDSFSIAQNHKLVAVLPPTVSIAASKKIDIETMKEQQITESLNFQKEIHAWMLKRKMQGKIRPEILDIETTKAKLAKAGYPESIYTPAELAEILGVDGVIASSFAMSKPMSEGGAIALGLLTGGWGATNEVSVTLSIHDKATQKLIWNFDHKYTGGVGSSPSSLVDELMRYASNKMPYVID